MTEEELKSIVARQIATYNAHDVDEFALCYASETYITQKDGSKITLTQVALRELYTNLFKKYPKVEATILKRVVDVASSTVTDLEQVNFNNPDRGMIVLKVVYTIEDGKISRVVFSETSSDEK